MTSVHHKFENTTADMLVCLEELRSIHGDTFELSEREQEWAWTFIRVCENVVKEFGEGTMVRVREVIDE